jgi:hypothetical protein
MAEFDQAALPKPFVAVLRDYISEGKRANVGGTTSGLEK